MQICQDFSRQVNLPGVQSWHSIMDWRGFICRSAQGFAMEDISYKLKDGIDTPWTALHYARLTMDHVKTQSVGMGESKDKDGYGYGSHKLGGSHSPRSGSSLTQNINHAGGTSGGKDKYKYKYKSKV